MFSRSFGLTEPWTLAVMLVRDLLMKMDRRKRKDMWRRVIAEHVATDSRSTTEAFIIQNSYLPLNHINKTCWAPSHNDQLLWYACSPCI